MMGIQASYLSPTLTVHFGSEFGLGKYLFPILSSKEAFRKRSETFKLFLLFVEFKERIIFFSVTDRI